MGISTILAQDATSLNEHHIPVTTLACGYDTGSGGIQWTPEQFAGRVSPYPPIHIDQDPGATDHTADVLDVESGAATIAEIPGWYAHTLSNYLKGVRPGQRKPIIYCSMSPLTSIVNELQSAGLTNVGFWTAEPNHTVQYASTRVVTAKGPYPCIGVQYAWSQFVDFDLFNLSWVTTVSVKPVPPPPPIAVTAQVTWKGLAGMTSRKGIIPIDAWNRIHWIPNSPD